MRLTPPSPKRVFKSSCTTSDIHLMILVMPGQGRWGVLVIHQPLLSTRQTLPQSPSGCCAKYISNPSIPCP